MGNEKTARLSINNWSEEDRPREKLAAMGAESLTNAELLAILIGSGNTEESAVDLMKKILNDCKNRLNVLGKMSIAELTAYKGIGEAKAITILAACELGKRRQSEEVAERKDLGSATAIYNFMRPKMEDLDVEEAWVILLNQKFKLIKAERLSRGGITETAVDVRMIVKTAILNNSTVVVLVHNHPSNSATPGRDDDRLTESLDKACDLMRLYFLDHVIVTDSTYYSYREEGRL
ncbi:MAG: DNA repair protein RadC [Prevotella sp.]|uniref:RadC family protein n=1 Tax=Prevotella sp. TaxID=59823 RepID=UPI002A802FB1|nr:DNA repair protein RadC [Prevotella sp.]MDY4019835.1 DNA repair protein RadC [Prevotella sp.]